MKGHNWNAHCLRCWWERLSFFIILILSLVLIFRYIIVLSGEDSVKAFNAEHIYKDWKYLYITDSIVLVPNSVYEKNKGERVMLQCTDDSGKIQP